MILSKKHLSICLILLIPFLVLVGNAKVSSQENEISVFYGKTFSLENWMNYILTDYIISSEHFEKTISENTTGIKFESAVTNLDSVYSDNVLMYGSWDFENGCVNASFVSGGIEHFPCKLDDGFVVYMGKKYLPFFSSNFLCLKDGKTESIRNVSGDVDVFGKTIGNMMVIDVISVKNEVETTLSGGLKKSESGDLYFVRKMLRGNRLFDLEYELIFDEKSQIFEGRNRIDELEIIPGRIALCGGIVDENTDTILVNTLVCNANQATEGGRLLGVVTENNGESIRIEVCINQLLTYELKITPKNALWVVHDGRVLSKDELIKIPVNFPIEVIGLFSEISGEFDADLILTNPNKSSDFVFGVWDDENEVVTDYFGNPYKALIDDNTWIYAPGGELKQNTIVMSWLEGSKVVGLYVPEFGLLGMRITGWLSDVNDGLISLKCLGSMNYDLQGMVIDINCTRGCRAVRGGYGFVDLDSLEKGTFMHCWGIPDFNGNFSALMISVH